MNIGIFGNTNNYPYLLAKGLRAIGVGVKLVVNRKEQLHRPESKDPDLATSYPDWILDASHLTDDDFACQSPRIADVLNFVASGASAVILNDLGPSLYRLLERPAIALLTGSDLTYYGNFQSAVVRRAQWDPAFCASVGGRLQERRWIELVHRQRDGILAATAVSFGLPGLVPEGDALLREIGVADSRRMFIYMADTLTLRPSRHVRTGPLRVLNGARLNWCKKMPAGFTTQDNKGTDILLRGFARFLERGGDGELTLIAKGLHVAETRELVDTLGIAAKVRWLPELSLIDFRAQLQAADVICDQFGPSYPGMTALDAMAAGKPLLANFRVQIMGKVFPEPLPVLHADSANRVAAALMRLQNPAGAMLTIGARAREFAEKYLSPEANARACLERLGMSKT